MSKNYKVVVEIYSRDNDPKRYNGNLPELEEFFNKAQIIPRIGETVFFNRRNIQLAVSKPEDDEGFTTETILAHINALYATVTSVQYHPRSQNVHVIVKPDGIGYERVK